jgi:hypothetical protein
MPVAVGGDRANVRSWDVADVYTAVVGSTAPTDTSTALAAAFTAVGLLSEDGLTRTRNVDRNELRSLGGKIVRVKRSSQSTQIGFTALENIHKVFLTANPGSSAVTATSITTRTVREQSTLELAMVIHLVEGTNVSRLWIPKAEVFADGDTPIRPTDMYSTPMTAMIYPDSTGVLYYEITNDPGAAAS